MAASVSAPATALDALSPAALLESAPAGTASVSDPLFISVVTETFPPEVNGVARTLKTWCDGLWRRGHRIQVVRPRQDAHDRAGVAERFEEHLQIGVPIPFYQNLRFGLTRLGTLDRLWRQARPDVVYIATEGPLGQAALKCAHRQGIPALSGFHTNFHSYCEHYQIGFLKRPVLDFLKRFHNRSRCTLVPTEEVRAGLEAHGYRNVEVVARGVDTERFAPALRDPALRAEWGIEPEGLGVIYVGRLAPEKNIDLAVRAFLAIREQRPDARFILVGDGPMRAQLQARYPEFIFPGQLGDPWVAHHYASADIFLFPSESETFGNVVLEALASGLAVIGYDYAATRALIEHDQSGVKVPLGDAEGFIAAARQLAGDPSRYRQLGQRARQVALNADWDRIFDRLEALMRTEAVERAT